MECPRPPRHDQAWASEGPWGQALRHQAWGHQVLHHQAWDHQAWDRQAWDRQAWGVWCPRHHHPGQEWGRQEGQEAQDLLIRVWVRRAWGQEVAYRRCRLHALACHRHHHPRGLIPKAWTRV